MTAETSGIGAVRIPTIDDIVAAREVLEGVSIYTPMEGSRWLSELAGGQVLIKAENLQRTGSFKIRGAYLRMSRLSDDEKAHGVVAASAGNHAQGVALAAQMLGIHATVFMPEGAPIPKEKATRGYGADVRFHGHSVDEALVAAKAFSAETGAVLIHPFDHVDIVAGQGTVGLEILEQCPEVRTIVVGIGGGGVCAGIAVAVKALRPDVRVIGVQAAGAAAYPPSLAAGQPVRLESFSTIADGIAVGCPGEVPFAHICEYVDDVVTVTDEDISRALLVLMERCKQVVEPAGAAGVAAMLAGVVDVEAPAVAVLSGGNIDPLLMLRLIEHGLAAAGRYLMFTVRCGDRPGHLARLLSQIAERGANVLDVEHRRHDPRLRLGEVEIALSVETRGAEHSDRLVTALRAAGYTVTFAGSLA